MFNFEQFISEWRGQMLSAGLKNPDIVDELESHLREDWARRVKSGESEEQAFEGAAQGVGQASVLKHEFAKLSGKKWAWLRKLKAIMAGAFVPVILVGASGAAGADKGLEGTAGRTSHEPDRTRAAMTKAQVY